MSLILDNEKIERKIKRLAYQVYEQHVGADRLIIAGIADSGYLLATKIAGELEAISPIKVELANIFVDKSKPAENTTKIDIDPEQVKNCPVVVVDDVLNTGRTMVYALYPFFRWGAASIKTAVLADRNHKAFPVQSDFTGISLATTLHEHITFEVGEGGAMKLFLS